ncbi:helix-turn-helix domain-containing protein [Paraglaciecola sp.]|uniref:AraC family transcriptional regulator n=1 Tax=Paraglaciecola sp. TaxID=1920173 RepID=UPI0030F466E1
MKAILFNGHDIVLLVIVYIGVLFAVITLCGRRDAGLTHLWLGLFLLSQAGLAVYVLVLYGDGFHQWAVEHAPAAFASLELALWLEGPLLVLYTRSVLYQHLRYQPRDVILLLPLLIYVIALIMAEVAFEVEQGSNFLHFLRSDHIQYYEHLRNLVRAGFGFWALFIILAYQRQLPNAYSNLDSLSYTWLKFLVVGFIFVRLWGAFYLLMFSIIFWFMGESGVKVIDFDLMGIMANYGQLLLISLLLYFSLSDSRHILRVNIENLESMVKTKSSLGYTAEQVSRLRRHMERERPYLDSRLKIDDLAHQISVSPKLLSNLINREFEVNFFEYINRYRVKEVCVYLADLDRQDQSAIDLAFCAGYNSKTSFNRLFKLEMGITPSEYRKKALNQAD